MSPPGCSPPSRHRGRTLNLTARTDTTGFLGTIEGLLALVGVLLVADGFRQLAAARGVPELTNTWDMSFKLVLFVGGIAMLIGPLFAFARAVTGGSGSLSFETPLVIPLVLAGLVPVIHVLMSLHRTKEKGLSLMPLPPSV